MEKQDEHVSGISSFLIYDMLYKDLENTSIEDLLAEFDIEVFVVEPHSQIVNEQENIRSIVSNYNPQIIFNRDKDKWTLYVTKVWLHIANNLKPLLAVASIPKARKYLESNGQDLLNEKIRQMLAGAGADMTEKSNDK
jgi:hypothetical protein